MRLNLHSYFHNLNHLKGCVNSQVWGWWEIVTTIFLQLYVLANTLSYIAPPSCSLVFKTWRILDYLDSILPHPAMLAV